MDAGNLSLGLLRTRLSQYAPRSLRDSASMAQAAVAMVLRHSRGGVEVLMIRRARRARDPWSGQMGFPGGHREREDTSLLTTAIRETEEEIGVSLREYGRCVGQLSQLQARARGGAIPLCIRPFVFELTEDQTFTPNLEVVEAVWIPMSFLALPGNRNWLRIRRSSSFEDHACYRFGKRTIWGLSLMMLDELIFDVAGVQRP